ncbi:MAG TPA: SAM-dependent methyltransferase [Thermodesulfovibrionales bacterium]|nr:SAM-dependent methyltransferase [Thermodesulfovibrionales bacterium]
MSSHENKADACADLCPRNFSDMNPLQQKIIERIKTEGPIPFETFMEMALYEPGLGYYAADNIEIGRVGDFYTSQHVHPAFGAMIAVQLEEMWETMGRPPDFYAIEPGAGAGLMCLDILQYLQDKEFYHALTYLLVETNPSVQLKQMNVLKKYEDKVRWASSLLAVGNRKGCILSNELLDAFPVHLVEMNEEIKEIYITFSDDSSFSEIRMPLSTTALTDYFDEFSVQLPKGYRTEINLGIKDWLQSASEILSEGFILTIDYGYPSREYYSEERNRGTLLCYYRHQVHEDPYTNIGHQDITAHVNFSSVKKWGEFFGFRTLGFCRQGTYLISLGIDGVIRKLFANSPDYLFEVARIKRLIFPGTLGETHKVMVQYKGKGNPQLQGFSMKNQAEKL